MACTFCAQAGTFTQTTPYHYNYTGDIDTADVALLAALPNDHEVTVVVNSKGGEYVAGLDLGRLTKLRHVHIVVDFAASAAGLWALGDPHVAYLPAGLGVWLHLPFIYGLSEDPETWMMDGVVLESYIMDMLGYKRERADAMLIELTYLRSTFGHSAYLVMHGGSSTDMILDPKNPHNAEGEGNYIPFTYHG